MMLKIEITHRYKKSYALAKKRGLPMEELDNVVKMLAEEQVLPEKYLDHALHGKYDGLRECHIRPNWLLVYSIEDVLKILYLIDTGSHSDFF